MMDRSNRLPIGLLPGPCREPGSDLAIVALDCVNRVNLASKVARSLNGVRA